MGGWHRVGAKEWGHLSDATRNPAAHVQKFKEEPRDRWLKRDEICRLASALKFEENSYIQAVFWLLLYTGSRKTELMSLKWADVDLKNKFITIHHTKTDRPYHIPLSDEAVSVFEGLAKVEGNPYVFVGKKQGAHLVNIDKAWRRVRKKPGLEGVRVHDLRRTVGSWLAQDGESLYLVGKFLNQTSLQTTKVYAHLNDNNQKAAAEKLGKPISDAAYDQNAKVVPLFG